MYKDIIISITLSLISVLGTLCGVYLANHQNSASEKEARVFTYQTKIIEQRINLVDRAANIFGRSPGLQDIWKEYIQNKIKGEVNHSTLDKLTESQGEFQSIIFLVGVYFGPKTQQSLKDLGNTPGPWWEKPKDMQDDLLSSMVSEINYKIQ